MEAIGNASLGLCLAARGEDWGHAFPSPKGWLKTTTDGQGNFSFTRLPEGAYADLLVEAPGKAGKWTFRGKGVTVGHGFRVGRRDLRFVLEKES